MAEVSFQSLSDNDKRDALGVAASLSGHRPHLLEKDIWVVQMLSVLYSAPFGRHLVFKGGTSLSKAYRVIRRFSEDIDITYNIRALVPDFAGDSEDPLPATRSQEQHWTRAIQTRLAAWTRERALPAIEAGLTRTGFAAAARAEAGRVYIGYLPVFEDYGFVRPEVTVEFGARSTGEPYHQRMVECDAAPYLTDLAFPTASPSVMLAERTFWEKATAAHVFCRQKRRRGARLSRHWHDLVRLDDAGYANAALTDRALALSVARHKSAFFAEKDAAGHWIDYEAAVTSALQLVPTGDAYQALADDYHRMLSDGMLLNDEETFEDVAARCADIEARANG